MSSGSCRIYLALILSCCISFCCNAWETKRSGIGLDPDTQERYEFHLLKKIVTRWQRQERRESEELEFAVENIKKIGNLNILKVTFTNSTFEPELKTINQDSLKEVLRSCPYEVTIDNKGFVTDVKGENKLIMEMRKVFTVDPYVIKSFVSNHIGTHSVKDIFTRMFSSVPARKVKLKDRWVNNVLLSSRAPIKMSSQFSFESMKGDSVFITIKAIVSAEQSPGGHVYMKGEQDGSVICSYRTWMPYFFKIESSTVTTTNYYKITTNEDFQISRMQK